MTLPPYTLDGWTVAHLFGWAWIGAVTYLRWRPSLLAVAVTGAVTGLAWELAEYWLVEALLRFAEPASNRVVDLIVDTAGAVAGAVTVRRLAMTRPT